MALRANAGRLVVFQIASEVARDVSRLATTFRGPAALQRGDQLVRAACSIPANISEGCGRGTIAEFRQFIIYARGSAHEVRSHLQVTKLIDSRVRTECSRLESRVTLVIKMLGRLYDHPPPS